MAETSAHGEVPQARSPRERWGTCCPFDPYCEHSYMGIGALHTHMETPITDAEAARLADEDDPSANGGSAPT